MYGLVAYIASGPHLRGPWLRLLVAVPVCALPLAYTQRNNALVTVPHIANLAAHNALIAGAGLVILVIVVLAVARFTDPNWTLAGWPRC